MMPAELTTPRLLLRRWRLVDAPELRRVLDRSQEHLRPWIPFMAQEPRSLEATREWVRGHVAAFDAGEVLRYAVVERSGGELVGEVMLIDRAGPGALEGGYWFSPAAGGRGLATEAVHCLAEAGFEALGIQRIEFHCDEANGPSNTLARRLGARVVRVRTEEESGAVLQVWSLRPADLAGAGD